MELPVARLGGDAQVQLRGVQRQQVRSEALAADCDHLQSWNFRELLKNMIFASDRNRTRALVEQEHKHGQGEREPRIRTSMKA